jgi:hypothetical protein
VQIEFSIPFALIPGSDPWIDKRVHAVLGKALGDIRRSARGDNEPILRKGKPGHVVFDLPHVFHSKSNPSDNAEVLQALLHCLTHLDCLYLRQRPGCRPLYESGVYYDRTMVWDTIPALYHRGYGDCKSLTCALLAEYACRRVWARPVFRWIVDQKGQTNYHILVQTARGFEDPSKVLGMGQNENAHFRDIAS